MAQQPQSFAQMSKMNKVKLYIKCAWCGKDMGHREINGTQDAISHTICDECSKKEMEKFNQMINHKENHAK